jgi:hypothetical protein
MNAAQQAAEGEGRTASRASRLQGGLFTMLEISVLGANTRVVSRRAPPNPRLERTGAQPARFARAVVGAGRSTAGR